MQFGTYTFTLKLTDDAQLPYYKGSTFRGVLTCTLLIFGVINRNLPYFIYAFDQMGKIGIGKRMAEHLTLEIITPLRIIAGMCRWPVSPLPS